MNIAMALITSQHIPDETISGLVAAASRLDPKGQFTAWILDDAGIGQECFKREGMDRALHISIPNNPLYSPEGMLPILVELYDREYPDILLFPSDTVGRELAGRLSCRTELPCDVGITDFLTNGKERRFIRPAYDAALDAVFEFSSPAIFAVSTATFAGRQPDAKDAEKTMEIRTPDIEALTMESANVSGIFEQSDLLEKEQLDGLNAANLIIAVGRGIGTKENVQRAGTLAKQLGGALACTRPIVADGWASSASLVGISGTIVFPDICIIVGASGSQAFSIGVAGSALNIGVNTDKSASLFRLCDVGIICDGPAFLSALRDCAERNTGSLQNA